VARKPRGERDYDPGFGRAALKEYEALEDEERRESGRESQVTHPHTSVGTYQWTGLPLRDARNAGVALLQE
jgi:hypothetical protein